MVRVRWIPVRDNRKSNGASRGEAAQSLPPGVAPQLTHTEREQLKEAMLQIMARGTRDIVQEAQFIKIKVLHRCRLA